MASETKTANDGKCGIAITVPHSYCPDPDELAAVGIDRKNTGHVCDSLSGPAAAELSRAIREHGNVDCVTFNATVPRFLCDLNRPACKSDLQDPALTRLVERWLSLKRDQRPDPKTWIEQQVHLFRSPVLKWLGAHNTKCSWLLDIHSFDRGGFGSKDHEVVLLDHYNSSPNPSIQVAKFLTQHKVDAVVIKGADASSGYRQNANVNEAMKLGLAGALLIEFFEELSTSRMREICHILAHAVLVSNI